MQPNPDKTQDEKDQRLLLGLLLVPVKRPTIGQRINSFFSHPAWQSAGAIIGLLSLIVTIYLTIYIFNLGQEQTQAHINYVVAGGGFSQPIDADMVVYDHKLMFSNSGPSTANGVVIILAADNIVRCEVTLSSIHDDIPIIRPSEKVLARDSCTIHYDYFYPNYYASIVVSRQRNDGRIELDSPLSIFVAGANMKTISNSYHEDTNIITSNSQEKLR